VGLICMGFGGRVIEEGIGQACEFLRVSELDMVWWVAGSEPGSGHRYGHRPFHRLTSPASFEGQPRGSLSSRDGITSGLACLTQGPHTVAEPEPSRETTGEIALPTLQAADVS
jgi:hypothetical protein